MLSLAMHIVNEVKLQVHYVLKHAKFGPHRAVVDVGPL